MLGIFSVSEYFSEYEFMVIHIVEKASTHGDAQKKESAPVERGVGSPLEEVLGASLKFQITIFNDQNNGITVKINPKALNFEPVNAW